MVPCSTRWAHPRSRGENLLPRALMHSPWGSSPLTRGKREGRRLCPHGCGLIPAHAGKTSASRAPGTAPRAHPRSRGENRYEVEHNGGQPGSSPLTRGKPSVKGAKAVMAGLIPAHAGKTFRRQDQRRVPEAHPRSRGENALSMSFRIPIVGSSPLTRGKHPLGSLTPGLPRLIPAHAGKTRAREGRHAHYRAHPRSRGENVQTQGRL